MADVFSDTGKAITTNRLKGSGTEPLYAGWGTGAGTAGASDTTLFTESRSAATSGGNVVRVTGTSSRTTTNVTNDTYTVAATITADSDKTITNTGLFDSDGAQVSPGPPSGGNIFVKSNFTGIALSTGESIAFTYNLTYA